MIVWEANTSRRQVRPQRHPPTARVLWQQTLCCLCRNTCVWWCVRDTHYWCLTRTEVSSPVDVFANMNDYKNQKIA